MLQARPPEVPGELAGLRVFVVEDESLVAMQLEDMLLDLGCDVVGLAMRLTAAHELLDAKPQVDVAILDVNIGGEKIYPIAERFRAAGVPIVFATGYGISGVEEEWHVFPIVQKPYTSQQIEDCLARRQGLRPLRRHSLSGGRRGSRRTYSSLVPVTNITS